jgi:hypothetical protein
MPHDSAMVRRHIVLNELCLSLIFIELGQGGQCYDHSSAIFTNFLIKIGDFLENQSWENMFFLSFWVRLANFFMHKYFKNRNIGLFQAIHPDFCVNRGPTMSEKPKENHNPRIRGSSLRRCWTRPLCKATPFATAMPPSRIRGTRWAWKSAWPAEDHS